MLKGVLFFSVQDVAEGIYADESSEGSDLYSHEPLYQTYHDIATARALVVQSSYMRKLWITACRVVMAIEWSVDTYFLACCLSWRAPCGLWGCKN